MMQQPMQPMGPPQQPMYQQQYVEHKPIDYLKPMASDFLLAIGIVFGLFLMMLGSMFGGLTVHNSDIYKLGGVVDSVGVFLVAAILYMGAIVRVDLDKWIRVAFIVSATLIIVWTGFWLNI